MPRLHSRRSFLRASVATAATGAALSWLPATIRQALAIEANSVTGTIKDVQHVVILMLENRSFDHYFGTLKGVRGFGDRFPIPLASGQPVWYQSDGVREITPFRLDMAHMNALKAHSTAHSFADTQAAWNQGSYGFWPKFKVDGDTGQISGHNMGYYTREEIPFQFALAEAFTLCDNYFCSVLSGTEPNRIVFWSGANFDPAQRRKGRNATPETSEPNNLRCTITGTWPTPGYRYRSNGFDWPTVPQVLQKAGVSWRIYQDPNDNWDGSMNGCLAFNAFRNAEPGSAIYENGMSKWSMDDLASHVQNDTLPQVCWILPSQQQSEHPSGSSPVSGADFTHRVLAALVANPQVWSSTVLFITYDENDGFFDHVPPPAVPSLNPDDSLAGAATLDLTGMYFHAGADTHRYLDPVDTASGTLRPYGMGPRVPMYVVSPWSKGGWVSSQVFDHTSVAQFLERRFDLLVPAISPWHRAVSGDLSDAFDFAAPNDPTLPGLPDTRQYASIEAQQLTLLPATAPATLASFVQDPGTRPSRATPYVLEVNASTSNDGKVTLQFVNSGRQGAVFHVYDMRHLERIPRRYTVEAGKVLDDSAWQAASADGSYDLIVFSTNGFVRTFKGSVATALVLKLAYDTAGGAIRLQVSNSSPEPVNVTITANAYRDDGPWTLSIAPRGQAANTWRLDQSGNWYDFTVQAAGFERRFAGRMENGQGSISDPAMGA
ncbi:phosphocholine-specific phospholipase C [Pseudomonas akapageensis]|uniref:phosphocholine-specific phospholipase C n=1 Tax=Pseudomonas akapageensis TaxID=2609961 RepID=UPI00140CFCBF|nr:phospholipase C, phosphocholine-specific [Pseudomonas akapageensis]